MPPSAIRPRLRTAAPAPLLALVAGPLDASAQSPWRFYGHDLGNTHHADTEAKISPETVGDLQLRWAYTTTPDFTPNLFGLTNGDIAAPPAVVDGTLYFPDWSGNLQAVDAATGQPVWKKFIPFDYSRPGKFMFFSRNTPAVQGDRLIIGSKRHILLDNCPQNAPVCIPSDGAVVAGIDRNDGSLLWSTVVDPHPAARITGSPVIHGATAIVPVSSWEEELAIASSEQQYGGDPTKPYPCCSFRGSVVAIDITTGEILWQTYMSPGSDLPAGILEPGEQGFFRVSIYSGSPSIDLSRGRVYVATANNYTAPAKAVQCELVRRGLAAAPPELPEGVTCDNLNDVVGNYVDAIVALDLDTGEIDWAFRAREYDPWVHARAYPDFYIAGFPPIVGGNSQAPLEARLVNCSTLPGPDFGFGQAPMILDNVRMPGGGGSMDLVGAGEKSGIFWMLDPDTGEVVWSTRVSPGGVLGGMQWGSATDGSVIYTASTNMSA